MVLPLRTTWWRSSLSNPLTYPTPQRGGQPTHRITHELSSWRPCLTLKNGWHRHHHRHCHWWWRSNLSHQMACNPHQQPWTHLSPTTIPNPHKGLLMPYPQAGDLYSRINDPNEIILIIRMTESKRLVKTQHITDPINSGWRGVDDIKLNWKPLTKDNKWTHSTNWKHCQRSETS